MAHQSTAKGRSSANRAEAMKNIAPIPLVLDVDQYGGKWIATFRGHIVASAANFAAANALLDAMGFGDDVILTRVPRSGDFVL